MRFSQTIIAAALLTQLYAGTECALADSIRTQSPTFGFEVEQELPPLAERQENAKRVAQEMLHNADMDMERKQAQRELKQQETLLYVALQKLNGKTPLYGDEKADLEQIAANARAKIRELKQEYKQLAEEQTAQKLAAAEHQGRALAQQTLQLAADGLSSFADKCSDQGCENTAALQGTQSGFFNYGDEDSNNTDQYRSSGSSTEQTQHNPALRAVDSVLSNMEREGSLRIEENEEEEQVTPLSSVSNLMSPDDLLHSQNGILIPNQPLQMTAQMREKVRAFVQQAVSARKMRLKAYERDMLNALLFNYGVQVLDDGNVIILETYLPDNYDTTKPMLAPGVPMPDGARQIVRAPVNSAPKDEIPRLIPESEIPAFTD